MTEFGRKVALVTVILILRSLLPACRCLPQVIQVDFLDFLMAEIKLVALQGRQDLQFLQLEAPASRPTIHTHACFVLQKTHHSPGSADLK